MKIALAIIACTTQIYAVDGDTLACGRERYRLQGLDAPELHHAKCPMERTLAQWAKRRLNWWLDNAQVRLVAALHPDGTPKRAKFGPIIAWLLIEGERDVAEILIREGLARPYDGRGKRKGWC